MKHTVLFTGGFDSSYYLCKLAQDKDAIVQPVYLLFPDDGSSLHVRPELEREIKAQDEILEYVRRNPNTKAEILQINRIHRNELSRDSRVFGLEEYLAGYRLGWQYLYFCILARWYPFIALCQESFPCDVLSDKLKFKIIGNYRVLVADGCGENLDFLFGKLSWPIWGIPRKQMVEDLKSWGYDGIFKHVWWCYNNINGEACGICDNCIGKISEGLGDLFSEEAIHRYLVFLFVKSHYHSYYWKFSFREYFKYNTSLYLQMNCKPLNSFKIYDNLFKLKIPMLKKAIIEGSFKYGYSNSRKKDIISYKNDKTRKHMLDNILK